ncbi:MAG TPA: endopeptidase La [Thermoleophilaceae bacterium]|nr:endopeptidase La [Thermoleophilaceae bacterium]
MAGSPTTIAIPTPDGRTQEVPVGSSLPPALPVLPLKDSVPFPDTLTPLAVGQPRSIELVNEALSGNRMVVMVASRDGEIADPGPDDLYTVGVAGVVARMLKVPDGSLRILVHGSQRVELGELVQREPFLIARVTPQPDVLEPSPELEALFRNVQTTFSRIVEQVPYLPEELQMAVANVEDPAELGHMIAGSLRIGMEERQALLEERDVAKRLRKLSELLAREAELISIGSRIQSQVESEIDRGQREFYLRQQLKAIQEELGEVDEQAAEASELRERIEAAELPEHAKQQAERELARFERLPPQSAEHGTIRNYLEWLATLPWSKATDDHIDLEHARAVLDRDHYDIERVKDRILEFLAVRKLKPDARSSILCFVGPPGVGKTSLGRSIAAAMGREFERISVGGVRDESEIRGHRRTYVGAMPGTIVRALRDAGSNNPVLMIDEIDKMGSDFRGDPSSAMLEVLDPEQNGSFRDHYLDLPFDLSNVLFITTANQLEPIPGPLRDRMETIQLAGYTEEEKLEIAKRYLVPRQIERNGLVKSKIEFADPALRELIDGYTREAGVRGLEREIGAVCRKVAREFAEGKRRSKRTIRAKTVVELLGKRRFHSEVGRRTDEPGVATGLAWTPVGGDVLFVEATAFPGEGKLQITGQLGDVMRESAFAALSYVKRNLARIAPDVEDGWFAAHDLHVHVPAGAIPKDGPSAGVTMATALASLVSERPVRSDTAMTGEITLTGHVLPIGGLKEKALAAQRAEISRVIAPRRNEADLDEFPPNLLSGMEFVFADTVDDVLAAALD